MTWDKTTSIGPGWASWTPNLSLVCDKASPTATECPGSITGLSWNNCKYTTHNGEFYGLISGTITNTGAYPYGGTRNHWDLALPFAVAGTQGSGAAQKPIGRGFWHTDTNPDKQGKINIVSFPNLNYNAAWNFIKVTSSADGYDDWAVSNLSYEWGGIARWNESSGSRRETALLNNSWSLRRLASNNAAWSGSAEAWTAPTPTINFSVSLRYMIQ